MPRLLLSQYYMSKGYGSNFIYARVIEAELDKRGELADLHASVERLAKKPWADIQKNLGFYAKRLYQAACEVAPDAFATPEDVAQALRNAEKGELYNVQFLVQTILEDLQAREKATKKPCRLVLGPRRVGPVDRGRRRPPRPAPGPRRGGRRQGQGKIWIFVTTHEDMGSIYQNARALKGDMKKIEGRFRFKFSLTTENIELVLEDRIFKKTIAGKAEVATTYNAEPGRPPRPRPARQHEPEAPRMRARSGSSLSIRSSLTRFTSSRRSSRASARGRPRRAALRLDPNPAGDHSGHPSRSAAAATSTRPWARWSASTRSTTTSPARARCPPTSVAN